MSVEESQLTKNNRARSWNTMPEVMDSQIMKRLTQQQIRLQEAKFELVTSEVSYLEQLRVLEKHYMKNIALGNLTSDDDFRLLFGNVHKMRQSCERFVVELKSHWKEDILLSRLTSIVFKHAIELNTFQYFVDYAKQYPKQNKCLRTLLSAGGMFKHCVETLKGHVLSQKLSLQSFLIVPVQHATRYSLLMESIAKYMDECDPEFDNTLLLVDMLRRLAEECNSNIKLAENREKLTELSRQLRTPSDMRPLILVTDDRFLVDETKVRRSNLDRSTIRKEVLDLFLFNDLLLLAKKQSGKNGSEKRLVDYCAIDNVDVVPVRASSGSSSKSSGVYLTLSSNHKGEKVDMKLSFDWSNGDEWISTLNTIKHPTMQEYRVVKEYTKMRKLDLTLCLGEVLVDVGEAPVHGFLKGTKLDSQDTGWFPEECVTKSEIVFSKTETPPLRRHTRWYLNHKEDDKERATTWYSEPF